ncbi:MAG: hypothetical protein ACYDEE_12955, partial [Ignavibacteriaceae bacterium]
SLKIKTDDDGDELKEIIETFVGETEVEISIDRQIFDNLRKDFPFVEFTSIKELMSIVDDFYKEVWRFEKGFFDSIKDSGLNCDLLRIFYNNDHNNIMRVGWGSGLPALSLFLFFDENTQKQMRNTFFVDRQAKVAPKSRRLIFENNQPISPLGWVQFDLR